MFSTQHHLLAAWNGVKALLSFVLAGAILHAILDQQPQGMTAVLLVFTMLVPLALGLFSVVHAVLFLREDTRRFAFRLDEAMDRS